MCEIMSIERLNFDLSTWSFQIHDTFCQLNDGAFSMDPTNQYIYSQVKRNAKNTAQTIIKQLLNNNFTKKIWTDKYQAKKQLES